MIDKAAIWHTLLEIAERLEAILESKQLMAKTVTLKVKYSDFTLNTRSKTHDTGLVSKEQISGALPELLRKTEVGTRPIRLIGITLANLHSVNEHEQNAKPQHISENPQLGLF